MVYIFCEMIDCLLFVAVWILLMELFWQVPLMSTRSIPIQDMGHIPKMALRCVERLPDTKHHLFLKRCLREFEVVKVPEGRLVSNARHVTAFVMPKINNHRIYLTSRYEYSDTMNKAATLLHECYHLYSNRIVDIAYYFEEKFDDLTKEQQSLNADSLAWKTLMSCYS